MNVLCAVFPQDTLHIANNRLHDAINGDSFLYLNFNSRNGFSHSLVHAVVVFVSTTAWCKSCNCEDETMPTTISKSLSVIVRVSVSLGNSDNFQTMKPDPRSE